MACWLATLAAHAAFSAPTSSSLADANRRGAWSETLKIFDALRAAEPAAETRAFVEAIKAHGQLDDAEGALDVLRDLQRLRSPGLLATTAAIRACATRSHWPVALSLLGELQADGGAPDVAAYNAALTACERGGQYHEAELLLREMRERGPPPDAVTFNTCITAAARAAQWERALRLLSLMEADPSVRPDAFSYSAAISACSRRPEAALDLLQRMEAAGVAPTTVIYNAAIRACATASHWPIALSLFAELQDAAADGGGGGAALRPDVVSYNAALAACERGGEWHEAELLLREMREGKGPPPDAVSYHTAIAACRRPPPGAAGRRAARAAVGALRGMMAAGLRPSLFGFTGALSACSRAQKWRAALAVFARLEAAGRAGGVRPDTIAANGALAACAGGGRWEDALALLGRMERAELGGNAKADRASLEIAARACAAGGEGARAAELRTRAAAMPEPPSRGRGRGGGRARGRGRGRGRA